MRSPLFYTDQFKDIEARIREFLNNHQDFLSEATAESTRAVGDAIQSILAGKFLEIVGEGVCTDYSENFARRAMADLAFYDSDKNYCAVDVKTHRLSTKFNMPNLISVERITRFYEDDRNYFVILMLSYDVDGIRVVIKDVHFVPIEFLSWECLTIGALGWGQIQIANSNYVVIKERHSRRSWVLELCDTLLEYYPREISKIDVRIAHFEKIREKWREKKDLTADIAERTIRATM